MNITKNFTYEELAPKDNPNWQPSDYQKYLLRNLMGEVQKLRDYFNVPFKITSGVRSAEDYNRLKKEGYNPSIKSDHFCGNIVGIDKNNSNHQLYGDWYWFSVGAVDIIPSVPNIYNAYVSMVDYNKRGKVNFGQIIHEKFTRTDGSVAEWIHLGNSARCAFTDEVIDKFCNKVKYLYSYDGGKTYKSFS